MTRMDGNRITMLGTGNALATRCATTHASHCTAPQDALFSSMPGGGNGILSQLERAGLRKEEMHDIFVTHAHTDHLLGVIWLVAWRSSSNTI